jgi:hypothetical protein
LSHLDAGADVLPGHAHGVLVKGLLAGRKRAAVAS